MWHQLVDYRGLKGIGRMLAKYNLIPYFGDYTTLWNRIHKINIKIIPENKEFVESDGTGLKTSNAGEYRQFKYIDTNEKRKKYLVVIITADVKKKLQYLEHIQREGQPEPKVEEKQIKEANENGYKIKKFYGDSAYDTNNMIDILQSVGAEAAIKIRKNAAPENIRGIKRRKEAKEYKRLGYRKWAVYKKYGMR